MSANTASARQLQVRDPAVACEGKVAFKSRDLAAAVADRVRRGKSRLKRSAYLCSSCNKWHVGSDVFSLARRRANARIKKGALDE